MEPGPHWLDKLIAIEGFHKPCTRCTSNRPKLSRETNAIFFDLDDETVACSTCVTSAQSRGHKILQIRRSSYHDVVKVSDIAREVKLQRLQTYTINGDKVVFIKTRPNPKVPKLQVGGSQCKSCGRQLNDIGNWYCSLQCKLNGSSFSGSDDWGYTSSTDSQPTTPVRLDESYPTRQASNSPSVSQRSREECSRQFKRRKPHNPQRSPFD